MKKITLIVAVAIAVISTSCTKDHTCTCTTTTSGTPSTSSSFVTTYHNSSTSDATLLCDQQATQTNQTAPVAVTGSNTTCTLK
jgi:hypothetical protein